jgi:hypothetical protein
MTIHEAHRLQELEEILGVLHTVEKTELGLLVLIGKISVLLPDEMIEKFRGLEGRKIGVLRLDGYKLRVLKN